MAEDEAAAEKIRQRIGTFGAGDRVKIVLLQTEEYYRIMATAGFILNDSAIRNFFIKRPGQVYLNVWHGTPLKTMGRRVTHEPHAAGSVQKNFIIADYLLYPSEYMMEHMVEDYMLAGVSRARILLGGYPRNAAFFDEEGRESVRRALGLTEKRVYAYMPTWRPSMMEGRAEEILREMDEGLGEDEVMFVNLHPLSAEGVDFSRFTSVRPFPGMWETYQFLNAADGLVTDYSSVFYDFAVTGRRIVLYTYDEEEYLAARGLYEPLDSYPFPRAGTVGRMLEELRREPQDPGDAQDPKGAAAPGLAGTPGDAPDPKLAAFLRRYCAWEGPDAAEKLCRQVFLGERLLEERSMPEDDRPVTLVYAGDLSAGERTEALSRFLASPERAGEHCYLTFNRRDVNETKDYLLHLPEGIDHIGRTGRVTLPPDEQAAEERYKKGELSFSAYWATVRETYGLERQRYYGDMPIHRLVLIPPGRPPGPEASEEELEFSTYEVGTDNIGKEQL